jgi:hypothetical protein
MTNKNIIRVPYTDMSRGSSFQFQDVYNSFWQYWKLVGQKRFTAHGSQIFQGVGEKSSLKVYFCAFNWYEKAIRNLNSFSTARVSEKNTLIWSTPIHKLLLVIFSYLPTIL